MPEKDHAFWDTSEGRSHREGPRRATPAEHAHARAGIFEAAARDPATADTSVLLAEARTRIPRLGFNHPRSLWRFSNRQGLVLTACGMILFILFTLIALLFGLSVPTLVLLPWLAVSLNLGAIIFRILHRPHLRRAAAGHCPDCNYDLTASPRPFPPSGLEGFDVGPARCAECGAYWPLIPPPAYSL